jgi:hypothetical protein
VVDLVWRPELSRRATSTLSKELTAARLQQVQRQRARLAAEEAELILRLAELTPDHEDPGPITRVRRRAAGHRVASCRG